MPDRCIRTFPLAASLMSLALISAACNKQRADAPPHERPAPGSEIGRSVNIDRITLGSGLIIEDIQTGNGEMCLPDSRIRVRYTCRLLNGAMVDSSGGAPTEHHLPLMIRGWQEGLPGMRVGGKRRLTVPASLGYGSRSAKDAQGTEVIPPDSVLVYEIDLLGIVPAASEAENSGG